VLGLLSLEGVDCLVSLAPLPESDLESGLDSDFESDFEEDSEPESPPEELLLEA
jgi:hypothetical protein